MFVKLIIIAILLIIFASLGSALFYLLRGKNDSEKMAKALTLRIGLSLSLFILLFIAFAFGLISPHQVGG